MFGPSPDEPGLGVAYLSELNAQDIEGQEQVQAGDRTAYVFDNFGVGPNALIVGLDQRAAW